jgi:cell wall assembly regulator SMI1
VRIAGLVEHVIDGWLKAGIQLNPGASPESLGRLQSALGVPLPPDVTAFFSAADGMAESEAAADLTNFWSVDRILAERLEREDQDPCFGRLP